MSVDGYWLGDQGSSESTVGLRILHYNAGGYNQFMDEYDGSDLSSSYDVVIVGESWVHQGNKKEFALDGFEVHHCFYPKEYAKKAGRHHGGVTVFGNVATIGGLSHVSLRDSACKCIVWMEFERLQLTIAAVYWAPEDSKVWGKLDHPDVMLTLRQGITEALGGGQEVLLIGDMNARIGDLTDVSSQYVLQQHALEPTVPMPGSSLHAGFYTELARRSHMDKMDNARGKELCQMLRDTGLVVVNGRLGEDAGVGAFTFKSASQKEKGKPKRQPGASMVDLACVSPGLYTRIHCFSVSAIDQDGKHAKISLGLRARRKDSLNQHASKDAKRKAGIRVCRPDVAVLTKYALPHLQDAEGYSSQLLQLMQAEDGSRLSASDALDEIIAVIRACVGRAIKEERQQATQKGEVSQTIGATWFDGECKVVQTRFKNAWMSYKKACRLKSTLSISQFDEVQAYAKKCRYEWQTCKKRKRMQYNQQKEKEAVESYFKNAKDFWQVFKKGSVGGGALDDVEGVTSYFASLLGKSEEVVHMQKGTWDPQVSELECLSDEDRSLLNRPLTREELCDHIMTCKNGKAADLNGITAEALKLVVASGCTAMLDCLVTIIDGCDKEVPRQLQLSKLTPIPKSSAKSKDPSQYRGIAVGDFFGKLGDKFRNARLTEVVERKQLRSFAQCGFRPAHGTLDAVFALQHMIDETRTCSLKDACLISCLVDFEKAFDKVDRKLMLRRCKNLGIHGKFLDAMEALYTKMEMVVVLNGEKGAPIETFKGTKQGSELSPILFGMFIEQLHSLLKERLPGAGPKLRSIRVPVLFYADDANMLSKVWKQGDELVVNEGEMQSMLDLLKIFCDLFDMKVNVAKTKFVIFRTTNSKVPLPTELKRKVWNYDGVEVKVVEEEKYLGVMMHGSKDPCYTAEHRAECGSKALHGMLYKCVEVGIYRPDIVCGLFDKLVRPVLSYGAQIWGPWMFAKYGCKKDTLMRQNAPEKVQTDFLRQISGMPKFVQKMSLYREFGRQPLMVQWLVLAARWWNKLTSKEEGSIGLATWQENVELMLLQKGKKPIWSSLFLKAMHKIGVLKEAVWLQGEMSALQLMQLHFKEDEVREAAASFLFTSKWEPTRGMDPRTSLSTCVTRATYDQWVAGADTWEGAQHMKHYMPLPLRRRLLAFRLGCHRLDIQGLRMQAVTIPRHERKCRVCGCGEVEDIMHFVMECGHYAHIRARHDNIFSTCMAQGEDKAHTLRLIFDHKHQMDLASCLQDMWRERERILERQQQQQQSIEVELELDHEDCEYSGYVDMFDSDTESECGSYTDDDGSELIEVLDSEFSSLGFTVEAF